MFDKAFSRCQVGVIECWEEVADDTLEILGLCPEHVKNGIVSDSFKVPQKKHVTYVPELVLSKRN